jgi:hypothetical protein
MLDHARAHANHFAKALPWLLPRNEWPQLLGAGTNKLGDETSVKTIGLCPAAQRASIASDLTGTQYVNHEALLARHLGQIDTIASGGFQA